MPLYVNDFLRHFVIIRLVLFFSIGFLLAGSFCMPIPSAHLSHCVAHWFLPHFNHIDKNSTSQLQKAFFFGLGQHSHCFSLWKTVENLKLHALLSIKVGIIRFRIVIAVRTNFVLEMSPENTSCGKLYHCLASYRTELTRFWRFFLQ